MTDSGMDNTANRDNNTNNKDKMEDNRTNGAERDSRNTSTMKVVAPPAGIEPATNGSLPV